MITTPGTICSKTNVSGCLSSSPVRIFHCLMYDQINISISWNHFFTWGKWINCKCMSILLWSVSLLWSFFIRVGNIEFWERSWSEHHGHLFSFCLDAGVPDFLQAYITTRTGRSRCFHLHRNHCNLTIFFSHSRWHFLIQQNGLNTLQLLSETNYHF